MQKIMSMFLWKQEKIVSLQDPLSQSAVRNYTVKISWIIKCKQLLILTAKFRLQLKKVGKTTRPFRQDLNQNP